MFSFSFWLCLSDLGMTLAAVLDDGLRRRLSMMELALEVNFQVILTGLRANLSKRRLWIKTLGVFQLVFRECVQMKRNARLACLFQELGFLANVCQAKASLQNLAPLRLQVY